MALTHELIPSDDMIFVGGGDFQAVGKEFLRHFIELGGLRPEHRVLDIGCGIGRMAVPLTQYLSRSGSYEGFDIVPHGVEWCQEKISSKYPNFGFKLADIRNSDYNPDGRFPASEFTFPYPDASFDFAFATSVFTHMMPRDVENYLYEIARVLKPGGRFLCTWFLWNAEAAAFTTSGRSQLRFDHQGKGYRAIDAKKLEAAVSFEENVVHSLYSRLGWRLEMPVHYGNWCGREKYLSSHDIVVATRLNQPLRPKKIARGLMQLSRHLLYGVSSRLRRMWRRDGISPAVRLHIDARRLAKPAGSEPRP